jgi:PelA/Pel-15E family pectate lyase
MPTASFPARMHRPARLVLPLCVAALLSLAKAAEPVPAPRPWEPDAFLPVTEARIAALPAGDQPAWRAYWQASASHARPPSKPTDRVENTTQLLVNSAPIPAVYSTRLKLDAAPAWYASAEARSIAGYIVAWQRPSGGWTKGGVYTRAPQAADDHHDGWSAGTFDNDSTIYELRFLALVIHAGANEPAAAAWRDSFARGLAYIFAAQYPNGGFPQIYPLAGGYHDAITYNDDAMVHILELLRDAAGRKKEYAFVPADLAAEAAARLARGIQCVLATQLRDATSRPTVWGQQHDALTLLPCAARNFEPVSECSSESAGLVQFLMSVPQPSPEIIAAVDGAMAWFPAHALHGVVWDREATTGRGLVERAGAPDLWARYYEIGTGRPVFGERDRSVHYAVTELTTERRKGYGWYNNRAATLPAAYAKWKAGLAAKP